MRLMNLLLSGLCLLAAPASAEEKIAHVNGVDIWYETFGNKEDAPLLLIMGCGGQAILWPEDLCEKLQKEKFYVIRYDNRDVGQSSSINYSEAAYNLMDMAKDAASLLDHLGIKKAHVAGVSMGGFIGQYLGAYFPERLESLVLMMTSRDVSILFDAEDGTLADNPPLPPPTERYLGWLRGIHNEKPETLEDAVKMEVDGWDVCNGDGVYFDREEMTARVVRCKKRQKDLSSAFNHVLAIRSSMVHLKDLAPKIKVPTLVIQGANDPIFPLEHGQNLAASIAGSDFLVVKGMGHAFNAKCLDTLVRAVKVHVDKSKL